MPKTVEATSCPYCHASTSKVTHTKHERTFDREAKVFIVTTIRRRLCGGCKLPFKTVEKAVPEPSTELI